MKRFLCLVLAGLLTACSGDGDGAGQSAGAEARSQALSPADPQLAAIYARSCRSCHAVGATGSPLTGDVAAWEPRMAKGLDILVDNVVNGFGGMPPFGLCMDCSAEEFEQLILFMAGDAQ